MDLDALVDPMGTIAENASSALVLPNDWPTPHERARLLQNAGMVHFDESPVPRTSDDDLNQEAFESYYRKILDKPIDSSEIPLPRMLENMRFLVTDFDEMSRLFVVDLLLFGKKPQDYLYHSRLSAVR